MRIVLIFVLGILDGLGTPGGFGFLSLILVKLLRLSCDCRFLLFGSISRSLWSFNVSLGFGHRLRIGTHAIVEKVVTLLASNSRVSKGFKLITLVGVLVHLVILVHVLSVKQILVAELLGLTGLVTDLRERLLDSLRRSILREVRNYQLYLICVVLLQKHRVAVSTCQGKGHQRL